MGSIADDVSTPVAFNYFGKAQSTFKPPLIANENAFLGDIASRYVPDYHLLCRLLHVSRKHPLIFNQHAPAQTRILGSPH